MAEEHANVSLLKQLDLGNLSANAALFAPDVVWHFFNPRLPDVQGEYVGLDGIQSLFDRVGALSKGTFEVQPVALTAVGDELVVTHTKNRMVIRENSIATDVVVVWRIVDGRISEVWDIPSVHAGAVQTHA